MAKLYHGYLENTPGEVCVYRMYGEIYLRSKSSLSRKRVMTSKTFEPTMKYAARMGKAAQIASVIYQKLRASKKERSMFQTITGEAASLLYREYAEQEVQNILSEEYMRY
jgi:hypothetical protein